MLETKHGRYAFFIIVLIGIGLIGMVWIKRNATEYFPPRLIVTNSSLPFSLSEKSDGVIAKFELNETQLDRVLECYRNHGFDITQGSVKIHGYGPAEVSFTVSATNQTYQLVVSQWKDL